MQRLTRAQLEAMRGILEFARDWQTSVPLASYLTNAVPKEQPHGPEIAAFLLKTYSAVQLRASHITDLGSADEFERYLLEGVFAILGEAPPSRDVSLSSLEREAARTEFDELGRQMNAAVSHKELAALGRRRIDLAPQTGMTFLYENHCWNCKSHISSQVNPRCPDCQWFLCPCLTEGACGCNFPGYGSPDYGDSY